MDVPEGKYQTVDESKERLKREIPIGSKYNNPHKKEHKREWQNRGTKY